MSAVKKHQLQYKLQQGSRFVLVVHLVSMDTKIDGEFENPIPVKIIRVFHVKDEGNITLTHLVEDAELWQKVTGKDEVRYNSRTDEVVPASYTQIAASIVSLCCDHSQPRRQDHYTRRFGNAI